jgi:hypothetical protein
VPLENVLAEFNSIGERAAKIASSRSPWFACCLAGGPMTAETNAKPSCRQSLDSFMLRMVTKAVAHSFSSLPLTA